MDAPLTTPCLLLHRSRVERNVRDMRARAGHLGVALRPHMKTAKCVQVAHLCGDPPRAVTVSTLAEAEYFAAHGIQDILYAVGIVPSKLERVARLRAQGVRIQIILDSPEMAWAVADKASGAELPLEVLIEVDTDGHRAGVDPDDPRLLEIAGTLAAAPRVHLAGVMTHAGGSYQCSTPEEIVGHAELERAGCVRAAQRLRDARLPCDTVSVGSTPTALTARHLEGVTEIRPGNFVFMDLFMVGLGLTEPDRIGIAVRSTVVGHDRDHNRVFIDAGALALSKDLGTGGQAVDQRYGLIAAPRTRVDTLVAEVNQEHGMVTTRDGSPVDYDHFPLGQTVEVLPVHACMTAAAYSAYLVVDDAGQVVDRWDRCTGW